MDNEPRYALSSSATKAPTRGRLRKTRSRCLFFATLFALAPTHIMEFMNFLSRPKITTVYVTLLNGSAIRIDAKDRVEKSTGEQLRLDDIASYLANPDHLIRHNTKASEYESEREFEAELEGDDEPWAEKKVPTYVAYDTIYARAVGNVVEVTDEEARD